MPRGFLDRLARPFAGRAFRPTVLLLLGGLLLAYRGIDLAQASLKAHGSTLLPVAAPAAVVTGDLLLYAISNLLAFALYLALAAACLDPRVSGRLRLVVLGAGVLAHLLALASLPALSIDAKSYFAHGAIGLVTPGRSQYDALTWTVLSSRFGSELVSLGWSPPPMATPYGPLWSAIENLVAWASPSVAFGVYLFKAIGLASALGSAWLAWRILGRIRPEFRLAGTVLLLWNPVVLVELSGEGHNDGLMTFFVLLAVELALQGWARRTALAATAGILVKWLPAVFAPPIAMHLWRTRGEVEREGRLALAVDAVAIAIGVTVLAIVPFWSGPVFLDGLGRSGAAGPYASIAGAMYRSLAVLLPGMDAGLITNVALGGIFVAFVLAQSRRVRDGRSLLEAMAWIAVAYLLLARGINYPWYAVLPIALMALTGRLPLMVLMAVMTVASRAAAPLVDLHPEVYPFADAAAVTLSLGAFVTFGIFGFLWTQLEAEALHASTAHQARRDPTGGSAPEARVAARAVAPAVASISAAPAGRLSRARARAIDWIAELRTDRAPAFVAPRNARELAGAFVAAARSERGPRSGLERLLLVAIVAIPMLVNAVALLPEIFIRIPSVNDDMLHWLFIRNASDAIAAGANPLDHWLPQIELGVPQFLFYQHLAPLVVVFLGRLVGAISLFDWFNLVRWALMVGFPLTVFWSMRRMGFSPVASAISAAAASLLSADGAYGFEYDSYVWRGWGLFTQLLAMHLSFVVLALAYRAIRTGRGLAWAGLAFGALVLCHLIYAYMMAITILLIVLAGARRRSLAPRLARAGVFGAVALIVSASMWLPFVMTKAFLNISPYLQAYKYDSFGAPTILGWLFTGRIFDVDRAPVLTALLFLGVAAALVGRRRRAGRLALLVFGVWLVLYFGRPTLGPIADLLPLHEGLLFHRFIGEVDLAAIVLMGVGGAAVWRLLAQKGSHQGLALAALAMVLVLLPALRERVDYYALNTAWMSRTAAALEADDDARAILARLRTLPAGRVYAGLPTTYGKQLAIGDLAFYNLFQYDGITAVPPATESMSLNSDLLWDFDESSPTSYQLYNVRYVVAPTGRTMSDFLEPVMTAGDYALYRAPTQGYGSFATVSGWVTTDSQLELLGGNRAWIASPAALSGSYLGYDYPATGDQAGAEASARAPIPGCADGGTVSGETVRNQRFSFDVSCPTEAGFVLRTTYHPNWQVLVDGVPAKTFMVSPSFVGTTIPAGEHHVVFEYAASPLKTPLAFIGVIAGLLALHFRRRLDLVPALLLRLAVATAGRLRRRLPRRAVTLPGLVGTRVANAPWAIAARARVAPLQAQVAALRVSLAATGASLVAAPTLPAGAPAGGEVAGPGTIVRAFTSIEAALEPRLARIRPPRGRGLLLALALLSAVSGLIASRVVGPNGPWLWNFDLPLDVPLAKWLHDGLVAGRLPLWEDTLGLGFPNYAEGKISLFYPPHWLVYQLAPLHALDVTRVLHLVVLGLGSAVLVLRTTGSRAGAALAALAMPLTGAVVSKLEWTNMIEAFAWTPWIVLPLVRRPVPTRAGVALAGILFGIQALLAHPNISALTALVVLVVLLAGVRRVRALPGAVVRALAVGAIGVGIGAVQLVPTALMYLLSVRSGGLSSQAIFDYSATPIDWVAAAFGNLWMAGGSGAWAINDTWHPDSAFGLLEMYPYVGLPILILATIGLSGRRSRPLLALVAVFAAIPVITAFHPALWTQVPLLNALRRPTRAYLLVDFALVIGAAIGLARLRRRPAVGRGVTLAVMLPIVGYVATLFVALVAPGLFVSTGTPSAPVAIATLLRPLPLLLELAIGGLALALVRLRWSRTLALALAILPIVPLAIVVPSVNRSEEVGMFDYSSLDYVQAVASQSPHRVLALEPPLVYAGTPNQLAMAGIPDVTMHSSLDLGASDALVADLARRTTNDLSLAKAVGVDLLVTFDRMCGGEPVRVIPDVSAMGATRWASLCRIASAKPPYWIPAGIVTGIAGTGSLVLPREASADPSDVVARAMPATVESWSSDAARIVVNAPAPGWVFIDRAWWPTWRVSVDGADAEALRLFGGQLVYVGTGAHVIEQRWVPWDIGLGLALTALTLLGLAVWLRRDLTAGIRRRLLPLVPGSGSGFGLWGLRLPLGSPAPAEPSPVPAARGGARPAHPRVRPLTQGGRAKRREPEPPTPGHPAEDRRPR